MKTKKYSKNFEAAYDFYLGGIDIFTFSGTAIWDIKHRAVYSETGKSAKDVFHSIESTGKSMPTWEPELLNNLLLCKASVNFHIKMWAEGRADGTLPKHEFSGNGETLHWTVKVTPHKNSAFWDNWLFWLPDFIKTNWLHIVDKKEPIAEYKKSMKVEYNLPDWVITAVEKQKQQIINQKH